MKKNTISIKKPEWLRRRLPSGPEYEQVRSLIQKGGLHTVCQEASCPNQFECFSSRTATFLILGSKCTRHCRFCNIEAGPDGPPDDNEPEKVAEAAHKMNLSYVVVTSVTRDDLDDGGSKLFARTILALKKKIPGVRVEVLIPDFKGDENALRTVLHANPNVLNHNMETVERLYPSVRPEADYRQSLDLLEKVSEIDSSIPAKSGLMLGLGEKAGEIEKTIKDLFNARVEILTIGQYLQPTKTHLPVKRFVAPEEFEQWQRTAHLIGIPKVASGPFVRSSYHAGKLYLAQE